MPERFSTFGRLDFAIVACGLVLASYFVIALPLLPQTTEAAAHAVPIVMGVALLIAVISFVLSVAALASVIKNSSKNRPVNVVRLVVGTFGIVIFGYCIFVVTLITAAFVLGTANIRN